LASVAAGAFRVKYCPMCGKEWDEGELCPDDGTALVRDRAHDDPLIGAVLKQTFHVEKRLALGGMGAVYRGVQMPLGRLAARSPSR
jgi:hypothetical protein